MTILVGFWVFTICVPIQVSSRDIEPELTPIQNSTCPLPEVAQLRRDAPTLGMDYLSVPPALGWGRTRASAHSPLFRLAHISYVSFSIFILRSCLEQNTA